MHTNIHNSLIYLDTSFYNFYKITACAFRMLSLTQLFMHIVNHPGILYPVGTHETSVNTIKSVKLQMFTIKVNKKYCQNQRTKICEFLQMDITDICHMYTRNLPCALSLWVQVHNSSQ